MAFETWKFRTSSTRIRRLIPLGVDVDRTRTRALFDYPKAGFGDAIGPPSDVAGPAVEHQRAEGEFQPGIFRNHQDQEVAAGLDHSRRFGEGLNDAVPAEVIDRVR